MERRLLKSAALIAVVCLAYACEPRRIEAGGSPTDPPSESPRATTSPDHTDGKPDDEPNAVDKHTDTAPPGAGAQPERPWAHNTGPSDPGALVPVGTQIVTTNGAILEGIDVTGMIQIKADNVTIRNFRINGTSSYGIQIVSGHTGNVFEDGEITGTRSAGILGVGFTARRLHIHDCGADGMKVQGIGGPTLVESCFIERLGTNDSSHADGNQTRGGSNITFRYNNIYMPYPNTPKYPGAPYKSNAVFMLQLEISNFVVESNWLTGGNYTIYCPTAGGVSVRNNIFGRYNGGWPTKEERRINARCTGEWTGNTWEDTGDPI